jgi:hypothetical protein
MQQRNWQVSSLHRKITHRGFPENASLSGGSSASPLNNPPLDFQFEWSFLSSAKLSPRKLSANFYLIEPHQY